MADNKKRYYRSIKEGDVSLLAPGGNGVFMDGKNTYLFTENTTQDLDKLQQEQYNGTIPIDPNNVASAIIISKDGSYNTTLGNNNIDTLNLNDTTNPNDIIAPEKPILEVGNIPAVLPTEEPTPIVTTPLTGSVEEEANTDLYTAEFDSLPPEEGVQIYEVIQVKENEQFDVRDTNSPSLVSEASLLNIVGVKNRNKGKIPQSGADFEKYGSSFKLIQNEGKFGSLYYYPCALFNQGDKQWGSLKSDKYTMKGYGCAYNSFSMLATHIKNNAGYTPEWFWSNSSKSVVVYWSSMVKSIGVSGVIQDTTSLTVIDTLLKTRPLAFEWDNKKISNPNYKNRFTKNHHWMVINGKNKDGTYVVFDPNGGKIWPAETKESIGVGLIRTFYLK